VISTAGRRALASTTVGDQDYVALDDLAAFIPLTVREDRQGVLVTVRGRTIVASRDRPLASVDGRVISLPGPLTRAGNRWLAPVDFVPRALAPLAEQRIEYRRASRLILIGAVRVPRVTTRIESVPAGARVTLDIVPPAAVTTATDADHVTVRFEADALDFAPLAGSAPLVEQVRADQPSTVTVTPAAGADARTTTSNSDTSTRVVIDIAAATQTPETSAAAPPPPAAPASPPPEVLAPPRTGVHTVVLDAGHGGDDAGVRASSGTTEKQVTLDFAKRIKSALESRLGVRVILTRDDDKAVGLDERTAIANNGKGDLFLSLHMNAAGTPKVAGAAVYVMRLDREGEDARREAGDQAVALPVLGGGTRIIETIRWDLAQARHLDDSARLAMLLSSALEAHVAMAAQPVQAAPLRVLAGLNMPAAIVELGFLTNPDQEKQVTSDEPRATLVQAVVDAVGRYASSPPASPRKAP
jgi:N-acetylmuramoyl-L-alanine amidase